MLASSPASTLNQNSPDLGIPDRFSPKESDSRNQQSLKVTHRLSAEMQATEDRIRELEAKVRHHEERADRAEKWLYRITLETEQQLLGREQGLPLQPPPL
jgi:hypothetical protein